MNKKILLSVIILSLALTPLLAMAVDEGLVKCGNDVNNPCDLDDFMTILDDIYTFIVYTIAAPLAVIAIIIGGVLMMTSAGNPNMMSLGKKVFWSAIIGLVLAFGAKAIINFVLEVVGYNKEPI
ncbi:MAG: pilin [Candidatus Staskawiczbacteria bacterium]|jgi:type IV secretory pathway VirB2 component (pilin)